MPPRRIGFATAAHCPRLTADDQRAAAVLEARGLEVCPVVWSGEDEPAVDSLVIRSTWDYHQRPDEFRRWLDRVEAKQLPVWNPASVLRWNLDKRYLRELEQAGVRTVPTVWLDRESPPLRELLESHGWDDVVVKPAISASGWRTFRSTRDRAVDDEPAFRQLVTDCPAMLQPFIPQVAVEGEWSLMFFGGKFSHAVLKQPAPGGFLVQTEHGGRVEAAIPTSTMVQEAEEAVARAPGAVIYGRVDGVREGCRLRLMELELLEPVLFFEYCPLSPHRFADALMDALTLR